MKELFEQYGPAIIVAAVITLILGLVIAAFKLPAFANFLSATLDKFMTGAGL